MFDSSRIVQRRRHAYKGPAGLTHRFWTIGLAPATEALSGSLTPISVAGQGTLYRKVLEDAWQEFCLRQGTPADLEAERILRRLFRSSPRRGVPSPREDALLRWHSKMDWYVCEDGDEGPGALLRDEPFRFPATCLSEGLLQSRIYPQRVRRNLIAGEGEDRALQPYGGRDPSKVAEWWGCFHFGFPRVKLIRMQDPKTKQEITFTEEDLAVFEELQNGE